MGHRMAVVSDGGQRDTQGPISGLIPTGRESDCGSPVFQVGYPYH